MRARRRGAVLIVALAVLALLSLFAVSFATLVQIERSASANYVDGVRARVLADAGVARAGDELRAWAATHAASHPDELWVYPSGGAKPGDTPATLGPAAIDPSRLSFYGKLGRSYSGGVDEYRVKVVDASSKLDLNDARRNLAQVIDALGRAMKANGASDPVRGNAKALIDQRNARPSSVWRNEDELRRDAIDKVGLTLKDVAALLDVATLHAPIDAAAVEAGHPRTTDARDAMDTADGWTDDPDRPPVLIESPSAPVNVNLAPVEVLAALISGLEGRARYVRGSDVSTSIVDKNQRYAWPQVLEETAYSRVVSSVRAGPVDDATALAIAKLLVAERPFESLGHVRAALVALSQGNALDGISIASSAGALADPGFDAFAREARASLLAAAFNPNGQTRGSSEPVGGPIDRTQLVRTRDDGKIESSARLDLCVAPLGVFEVTSIGMMKAPDAAPGAMKTIAESHATVALEAWATTRTTTQRDFTAAATAKDVATFPESEGRWVTGAKAPPESDPRAGWLELAPRPDGALQGIRTFASRFGVPGRANPYDADEGDTKKTPFGEAPSDPTLFGRFGGALTQDGLAQPGWEKRDLYYRAAADQDGVDHGGPSAETGNVGMKRGALELWYKPDFDWACPDGSARRLFCGIVFVGHCRNNSLCQPQPSPTSGTQMFLFRNAEGDLRVTRLHFEVVGSGASQQPLVHDPMVGDWVTIDTWVARANASIKTTTQKVGETAQKTGTSDGQNIQIAVTQEICVTTMYGYGYEMWPPPGIPNEPGIAYARRELVAPFSTFKNFRRGEWHHVAVVWDDGVRNWKGLRLYVDGREVGSTPHYVPGAPWDNNFCRLNQAPGEPRDVFQVGRIVRPELVGGQGVVKFEQTVDEPCNGCVGSVIVYEDPSAVTIDPPERFPRTGTLSFDVDPPRDAQGNARALAVLWTAYLPTRYGALDGLRTEPDGAGAVEISASVGANLVDARQDKNGARAGVGCGFALAKTDKLRVIAKLEAAEFAPESLAVASPVLDDVLVRTTAGPPRIVATMTTETDE